MAKAARRMPKKTMQIGDGDRWASLPSAALLTIFRRMDIERFHTIPLVCKSWRSVSEHPQCWSSMIPDSVPPERAFIKNCGTFLVDYSFHYRKESLGVSRLETLIKKSGGGDTITSLYLSQFIKNDYSTNISIVFRLIADCCPNLKHLSFHRCVRAFSNRPGVSEEALLELLNSCKRLELIDFDYLRCVRTSSFIQKLAICLPHLRGIRIHALQFGELIGYDIAKCFPRLEFLNLARSCVYSDDLFEILSQCHKLQYLNIKGGKVRDLDLIGKAYMQIPEFYFKDGCPTCCSSYGDSDIANLNDFADQEEYGSQERSDIADDLNDQEEYGNQERSDIADLSIGFDPDEYSGPTLRVGQIDIPLSPWL